MGRPITMFQRQNYPPEKSFMTHKVQNEPRIRQQKLERNKYERRFRL